MSKEEILKQKFQKSPDGDYNPVHEAMDEYAKTEAIKFRRFGNGDIRQIYIDNNDGTWGIIRPTKTPQPNEIITDEQLYELYQLNKSKTNG